MTDTPDDAAPGLPCEDRHRQAAAGDQRPSATVRELLITLARLEDEMRTLRRRPLTTQTLNRRRAVALHQARICAQIRHRAQLLTTAA